MCSSLITLSAVWQLCCADLSIVLEPAKVQTVESDIVFLRVRFENLSAEPIFARHTPTPASGVLKLESRKRGEETYRHVPTLGENQGWGIGDEGQQQFAPRQVRTTAVVMASTERVQAFDGSGDYEVRVFLRDSERFHGMSEPILIKVEKVDEAVRSASVNAMRLITRSLSGRSTRYKEQDFLDAAKALPDSEMKRTLEWLAAVAHVRDAETPADLIDAGKELELLRKNATGPARDWIAITMARTYIKMGKLELAGREARLLADGSFDREEIEKSILAKLSGR